jgi:uncharacterized DUF497 family protein
MKGKGLLIWSGCDREITINYTMKGYLAFVSHCERGERIRIISARRATPAECEQYEEGTGSQSK